MSVFHKKFIGTCTASEIIRFSGGDSEELLKENLKTQPKDWYYRTANITYHYNNNGHRCKDIENIDLENYILFTGCSHTEGVGLELEKTYPYLVAEALECDYYNLGVSGSGMDILEYNLITWFSVVPKKPKFVVIQWPDHSRFTAQYPGYANMIESGSWTDDRKVQEFVVAGEDSGFFHARKRMVYNLLNEIIDVPVYNVQYTALEPYSNDCIWLKNLDKARDLCHTGMKSNQNTAETILTHISLR